MADVVEGGDDAADVDPLPPQIAALGPAGIFLPYQAEAIRLSHEHELLFVEKSRRIGITWAFAGDDPITAGTAKSDGGDDVLYISYSHDMAREYIDAAAAFARAFMGVDAKVGESLFEDEDPARPGETRQIKGFRIDFASGNAIQALSSAPRSLRGKQGLVRIDEGAFVDNLDELIKAALALLIWGSRVVVMSTHDGVDNTFNKFIQEIRAEEREGHVLRITFDDAVEQGLYERVCLRSGETPTPEGKVAWVAKIRAIYGAGAAEELDVIPSRGGGSWLSYDEIERAEVADVPVVRWSPPEGFARWSDDARAGATQLWCETALGPLVASLDPRAAYALGGDFARRVDLTDLWLLKEEQDRSWSTPFLVELRDVPISEQTQILLWLLQGLRRWSAALDAGGLGLAIAERAQQVFGEARVRLVHMRAEFWLTEAPPLKARFQDGRMGIPRDRDVAADLRGILVKGGVPYVPEQRKRAKGDDAGGGRGATRHFDSAVALVLASAAMRSGTAEPFEAHVIASPQQAVLSRAFGSEARDDLIDRDLGVVRSAIWADGPGWGA